MANKLPLALQPHHDGSATYVLNQKPKLLESVKIRIRVHSSIGDVVEVRAKASESGEHFPTAPAKIVSRDGNWVWYQTEIRMMNPKVNYRWLIKISTGQIFWINALGLHETDQPDIHDFRINIFSSAPSWGPKSIMYQVFPDRFARSKHADKHELPEWAIPAQWGDDVIGHGPGVSTQFFGGDLWGVKEHLDHIKKLGINLLYMTPFFPARSNHRYDASSFDEVDPLLGGNRALAELVKAAHRMKIRVIGDLTSNHSGDGHEWFRAAYKNPKAAESDFYYFTEKNTKYDSWFGYPSLPKFNWKSAELRRRFIEGKNSVVAKWLKTPFNLDGWRIDVANMTGRIRDEDMYHEVAQIVRKTMIEVNSDTLMLGEYTSDAAFEIQGDGWQGAMTYANFTRPIFRWLQRDMVETELQNIGFISLPETAQQFVASHRQFAAGFPWHVRQNNLNTLNTHDTPRFRSFTLPGAQKVAAAVQFTIPGIPMVWAGDEFGLEGYIGEKSRTPIPWNGERKTDESMIEVYSKLAEIRTKNPALTEGAMRFIYESRKAFAFVREGKKQSILVFASRGKDSKAELPLDAVAHLDKAENLFGGASLKFENDKAKLPVAPMSVNIWRLPAR